MDMDASYSGRVFVCCSYGSLLTPGKDSYLSQDQEAGTIADIIEDKPYYSQSDHGNLSWIASASTCH